MNMDSLKNQESTAMLKGRVIKVTVNNKQIKQYHY